MILKNGLSLGTVLKQIFLLEGIIRMKLLFILLPSEPDLLPPTSLHKWLLGQSGFYKFLQSPRGARSAFRGATCGGRGWRHSIQIIFSLFSISNTQLIHLDKVIAEEHRRANSLRRYPDF